MSMFYHIQFLNFFRKVADTEDLSFMTNTK